MNTKTLYIALAVIFVASVVAAIILPVTDWVRTLTAIPAIGSLFGALFQITRDRIAHERSLLLLEAQNSFTIGATSHMANVAFDKHVLFCEQYVSEMFNGLTTLFRRGPHADALIHADALFEIRRRWAVWLTPEVETTLEQFEGAFRTIGAEAWLMAEAPHDPDRAESIKKAYSTFMEVLGFKDWKGEPITGDRAVGNVVARLQEILGIDELTRLRSELVKRASANFNRPVQFMH